MFEIHGVIPTFGRRFVSLVRCLRMTPLLSIVGMGRLVIGQLTRPLAHMSVNEKKSNKGGDSNGKTELPREQIGHPVAGGASGVVCERRPASLAKGLWQRNEH